jgi:hypothetical protein
MGGACGTQGKGEKMYNVFVGKPEGKRPLGRPRRRWKDRIKKDLKKIGWEGAQWFHVVQNRDRWRTLVKTMMNLRVLAPRS